MDIVAQHAHLANMADYVNVPVPDGNDNKTHQPAAIEGDLTRNPPVAIIAGAAAGGVALIIFIVVIVVVLKRRR
ncbi:hypothetical protein DPMN_072982 [Dreissena polymorpha]|uniref:Uncharacterized protein n=2 Tax=Dreissena polymorpha TaxID=45954 RepID=A0A9D4BY78_DREPO|nr:hypothetical protein DPMN_072982 [Dreissena polymorpha]